MPKFIRKNQIIFLHKRKNYGVFWDLRQEKKERRKQRKGTVGYIREPETPEPSSKKNNLPSSLGRDDNM